MKQSVHQQNIPIVIIGCGFGGMALAIELKKAGMNDFVMLERADDVGGVWRDNTYPGAACDVVSRFYSFSGDQDYEWSTAFAPQSEIWDYAQKVVARHGIRPHVRFNTEVVQAAFDDKSGNWTVETADGARLTTPILVSAVGLFNHANMPDIAGRDDFRGVSFHSLKWNHDFALNGKTVAVIGCGASAVQFIPKIAPQVEKLFLYQRSPQYVMPKSIFPGTSRWDTWLQKRRWLRGVARLKIYLMFERFILRRRLFPKLRLKGEADFRALLERKVKDLELRKKLTPNYPMGCKRQLVSDVWYDALTRPNVEVIDAPMARIDGTGIVTSDGIHRKVDAIIYGTGFTPTAYLTPMHIKGLGGVRSQRRLAQRGGSLSRYHGDGLSELLHAVRTQHQCAVEHHLHAGVPVALYRERHQYAAEKARSVHERARRRPAQVQRGSASATRDHNSSTCRLFHLFQRPQRQDHHQLARLRDRIPLAHAGGEITGL